MVFCVVLTTFNTDETHTRAFYSAPPQKPLLPQGCLAHVFQRTTQHRLLHAIIAKRQRRRNCPSFWWRRPVKQIIFDFFRCTLPHGKIEPGAVGRLVTSHVVTISFFHLPKRRGATPPLRRRFSLTSTQTVDKCRATPRACDIFFRMFTLFFFHGHLF
jgi:hypothetical protein